MKRKIYIAATALMFLIPAISQAAEKAENSIAQASGISDTALLTLMLSFIVLLLLIINALANSIKGISHSAGKQKENKGQTVKNIAVLALLSTAGFSAQAAETATTNSGFIMSDGLFWLLSSLIVVLAFVIYVLFRALQTLIKLERGEEAEASTAKESAAASFFDDSVPIEEEGTIMLDHDYDGIKELDNNLPPWWVYMFYATIIFSVVYLVRFHITGDGKLSIEEYEEQMAEAAAQKEEQMAAGGEQITEDNVTYLADAPSIEKGAAIYKGNCATCHGQLGEGGAGPNLTDEYWIHGGSVKDIFSTIKYGVPAKGMIAWESQFSPEQMQQVASYIMTLVGTNPPNPKDPQGELYVPEENTEESSTDSTEVEEAATEEVEEESEETENTEA